MKIMKQLITNIKTESILIVVIFLLSSFIALYWNSPYASIFYLLLLILAITPFFATKISRSSLKMKPLRPWKGGVSLGGSASSLPASSSPMEGRGFRRGGITFSLFFLGIIFYAFLIKYIGAIELWGDEIGVIKIASLNFNDIVKFTPKLHAAVPPLDYWNLWLYRQLIDVNPQYQEIIYRVPYMFFHLISSLLFTLMIIKNLFSDFNQKFYKHIIITLVFLTYFFNPLLFFYSIEVRFYALAVLGVNLILFLYLENKLYDLKFLPLLLLFCLNSVFQFIAITPFLIKDFLAKKFKTGGFKIFLLSFILMFVFVLPKLHAPNHVDTLASLGLIFSALHHFFFLQFPSFLQITALIIIIFWALIKNKIRGKILFLILAFFFCLFVISLAAYLKGYFDFHHRHYLFTLPILLYLLFSLIKLLDYKKEWLLFLLIFAFFTLPWITQTVNRLITQNLFSKALNGSKQILQLAQNKKMEIIIVPNSEKIMSESTYRFNLDSFNWYAQFYPGVKISSYQNEDYHQACKEFEASQKKVIFSLSGIIACPENVKIIIRPILGSVIGYHE